MALRDGTILTGRNTFLDRLWTETVPTGAPGAQQVPSAPAGAGDLATITPTPPPLQIFPWWLYETPGAQDWFISSLNFTVAASVTTIVPAFSFTVNSNNLGVLKQVTMTVQNPTATISLAMNLLLNGSVIPGWSNVTFPPVSATALIIPFNAMVVRLPELGILTASFTESSGSAWTCSLQASGWQASKPEIARLQGNVNY